MSNFYPWVKEVVRDYRLYILLAFMVQFSLPTLSLMGIIEFSGFLVIWSLSGLTLIVLYCLRFRRKKVRPLDYLKLILVVLLPFSIFIGYAGNWSTISGDDYEYLMIVPSVNIIVLLFAYGYDYLFEKIKTMNKKYVIATAIQVVLCVVVLVYSLVQQTHAKERERAAILREMDLKLAREEAEFKLKVMDEKVKGLVKELDSLRKIKTH